MTSPSVRLMLSGVAAALAVAATVQPARAHPHVWVTVETTVIYDKETVTGLRQRWLFDEFYTSMAVQGLDANGDGTYDRSELAELAKINMEGLKEFDYFTFAKLGDQALEFNAPTEFLMEYTDPPKEPIEGTAAATGTEQQPSSFWSRLTRSLTPEAIPDRPKVLALEFVLPLKQPVLAEAEGFNFSTRDPSFFIWFDLAKDKPIKLADGAPAGCKVDVTSPTQNMAQVQQLGEAAFADNGGVNISFGSASTVMVTCPR